MSRNPLESNDRERVSGIGERRSENTERLTDRFDDATSKVKNKAEQWAESASGAVDRQRANVSSGLESAASTLHDKAEGIPGGERATHAVHRVADGMESTASYLREHDFTDMRNDLINLCKKYPMQALVSAAAVGFLVGRSVRR